MWYKKIIIILLVIGLMGLPTANAGFLDWFFPQSEIQSIELGALGLKQERNIIPATDSTYYFGTSTKQWAEIYTDAITISDIGSGECLQTTTGGLVTGTGVACGSGGGGGGASTMWLTNGTNAYGSSTFQSWNIGGTSSSTAEIFFETNGNANFDGNVTVGGNIIISGDTINDFNGTGLTVSSNILNVSGLTTSEFVTTSISQWANDSGYVTSTHDAVTIAGEDFLSLSTQQITANAINPDNLGAVDFGDWSCDGSTCTLDTTYMVGSNNLSELTAISTARSNLAVDVAGTDNSTDVTITGEDYLTLSTQQITMVAINPDNLASADFGDFTCDGTTCTLDATYLTGNENIILSGDVSGSGATAITTAIGANKVLESHLKVVDSPVDEECLTYEATTGDFEWQTCGAGGVSSANSITGAVNWLASGPGLSVASSSQNITYTFASSSLNLGTMSIQNSNAITVTGGSLAGLTLGDIVAGDVFYGSANDTISRLAKGSDGQILKLASGIPSWGTDNQGGGGSGAWATSTVGAYLVDTSSDFIAGSNATGTATFWHDTSAGETHFGSGGAGDSTLQLQADGTTNWIFGLDDSDNDAFIISQGATLGSNVAIKIPTSTQEVYIPNKLIVGADNTPSSTLHVVGTFKATGAITFDTDLTVANGGTGASTFTDHGVLLGSGTSAITALGVATNGQLVIGSTGADPVLATLNCDANLTCTTGAGTLKIDVDDSFLLHTGDIGTGVYDFGGATSFEIVNSAGGGTVNASGEITVDTTSRTFNFYDGTAEVVLNPEKCDIVYGAGTSGAVSGQFGVQMFNSTSTLTKVKAVHTNADAGNTLTFNLILSDDATEATSTSRRAFSAYQTTTSTSTPLVITSFANSTIHSDDIMRIDFQSASSTDFIITACHRENP